MMNKAEESKHNVFREQSYIVNMWAVGIMLMIVLGSITKYSHCSWIHIPAVWL